MKILFIFLNFMFILSLVRSANVTQTYLQERNYGTWSPLQQAQNINNLPASYFICKVSLRESKWEKMMWNCNCRRRWSIFRQQAKYGCEWCINNFMNKVDAIKIIYCHKNNWDKQIQKTFETGKEPSGNYREVMCPKNTYVNKISAKFGYYIDVDLGLVGFQLKCSSLNLKVSQNVEDNYDYGLSASSNNSETFFASSVFFKYQEKGKITGIKIGFQQPIVEISEISIKYTDIDLIQPIQTVVETVTISNSEDKALMVPACFKNSFIRYNMLETNDTEIQRYNISKNVITDIFPFMSKDGKPSANSIYRVILQNLAFNKNLKTTFQPVKQLMLLVPPKKQYQIKSIIREQNIAVPYQANLTFVDQYNGKYITSKIINGVWKGVLTYPPKTQIIESQISQFKASNLEKQNQPVEQS